MERLQYFGTDGIRGVVGQFPISIDFLPKLGWAAANLVLKNNPSGKVLIGKDPRVSGYMIESAIEAGLMAAGVDVYRLGVLPTAGIAYLTIAFRASMGIVISASHNPYSDNGIKFFNTDGYKLSTAEELEIEQFIQSPIPSPMSNSIGKAYALHDAQGRYIEYCKSTIPHKTNLKGFKIVLDCANGAAYHIAPYVFTELGAEVICLGIEPNGSNINKTCGACYPEALQKKVIAEKAHLGIAFDGDSDRVILVDHEGEIVDGDEILYIILKGLLSQNRFRGGIVGTVMSNMGLEIAVKNLGVHFIRTAVGDQHIIKSLLEKNWLLGAEPSGHIVYLPVSTTGDGIIAALQVLQTLFSTGLDLHSIKKEMKKFPQKLINVPYKAHPISLDAPSIVEAVKQTENQLKNKGRVLLRYSGTEPILRILVEGEDAVVVDTLAEDLAEKITDLLNVIKV